MHKLRVVDVDVNMVGNPLPGGLIHVILGELHMHFTDWKAIAFRFNEASAGVLADNLVLIAVFSRHRFHLQRNALPSQQHPAVF